MDTERLRRKIRARVFRLVCLCVLLISQAGLAQDEFFYYDYLDHMALKGGIIEVGPGSPMHSTHVAGREELVVQQLPSYNVVTLINNGPKNRIDLVILGDGYTRQDLDSGQYANVVNYLISGIFTQSPFNEYASYFNVYRVDVVSNQSGVPVGTPGDTALEMYYAWTGVDYRALVVNIDGAREAASQAPDWDQILALANSTTYGGAGYIGGNIATTADGNQPVDTALHEFGHSFANLGDEYFYEPAEVYNGSDDLELANNSIYDSQEMSALQTKWYRWLGVPTDPSWQGPIGTYEGAGYYTFGLYRPTDWSKMRGLGLGLGWFAVAVAGGAAISLL